MDDTTQVLIVNDEIGALTLIGIMLERAGIGALKATTADQALLLLEEETPNLILTDDMMPGMDGFEFCRRLRARARFQHFPILLMTARFGFDRRNVAIEAGFNDMIPVPVLHHDLVGIIQHWLAWGYIQDEWQVLEPGQRGNRLWGIVRDTGANPYHRVAALNQLAEVGLVTDLAHVLPFLAEPETMLQVCAVEHLALFPLEHTRDRLLPLLGHDAPEVREVAITTLHKMQDSALPPLLVDLLAYETYTIVLMAALRALGPAWDQCPVGVLVDLLDRRTETVNSRRYVSDWTVNSYLYHIFEKLPRDAVVEQLIARLPEADAKLRRKMIHPLARLKSQSALVALSHLANDDPDEYVRNQASSALRNWENW